MQEILSQNVLGDREVRSSGVSWGAVFAGALATAALYLILLALGAGFGLSSVSPWSDLGVSASAVGASTIAWLIVTEILSSAMGGYLAGRLRTKWTGIHLDEVYFRDTAHGFLAWCTALVFTAAFLASAMTALFGHTASAPSFTATQSASNARGPQAYFVDKLFRNTNSDRATSAYSSQAEATIIIDRALLKGELSSGDRGYLDQIVSVHTGQSFAEADRSVSSVLSEAQQSAVEIRKAAAHTLLWMFIALLLGAFTASLAATLGGKQRDNVVLI